MAVNKVVFGAVSIMDISDSTVTADKLAKGVTAYDKSGEKITGTMEASSAPTLQEKTVIPSTSAQSITADNGYDGLSKVTVNGDVNLTSDNIKSGTSIFGVTGSYVDSTPIEIYTDAGMEAVLTSSNVGKVYKFIGTSSTYTNGDLYIVEERSTIGSGSYVFRHYVDETPAVVIPYLCFTAEQAGSTVAMTVNGTPTKGQAFEYSTNGTNWSEFIPGTTTITLSNIGDKVYFRGDNTTVSETVSIYYKFVMSGKIAASGNIMSLLDKTCQSTTILNNYCYENMFYDCTSLTTAPALPATTLANYCYENMFYGCTNLTTAPALPATTLASYCYNSMFNGCTNLTTAPALPAITLESYCYNSMFRDCTSLTTAPALPAITLASNCYNNMFRNCTKLQVYSSSETGHDKAWPIPTNGTASSYTSQSNMFYGCPGSYKTTSSVSLNTTFYTQNTPV